MIARFIDFVKNGIWRIRPKEASRSKSFFIRQFRIFVLSLRGFDEDRCSLRASALTFYSLLSIVPVVAMFFGIAKGFGFEQRVQEELLEKFQGQKEVIEDVIDFAHKLLENASGGLIAGIGVALLFWSIIKVLGNIEHSFNHIWGIKKARAWGRKFSDYLSFMLISPVLLVMSSSITVFIKSRLTSLSENMGAFGAAIMLLLPLLKFLPFLMVWILFTFIFYWMPNTKVRFRSSLVAGITAGTLFQVVQWLYVTFQIGVAKYGAIYGSFAALPLFLVWLQISWLIVLFGAELSFAHQNVETYEFEQECYSVSHSFKMLLSLIVTHLLVRNFCRGEKPSDAMQISQSLDLPIRLVRQILFELTDANILTEIKKDDDKGVFYQPSRDVEGLTVRYVINALEQRGSSAIPITESRELGRIKECVKTFDGLIENSSANMSLKDI
ncbi:MAG: YihY/virulence factor BrkB family protein [Sedimentisphaerales bacterium]|nr:YihY/virulence factor BrkB family protein [Sedimentisphaerales bacterium]